MLNMLNALLSEYFDRICIIFTPKYDIKKRHLLIFRLILTKS